MKKYKSYIISGVIALCVSLGVVILAPEIIPGLKTLKIEHISGAPVPGAVFTLNKENELVPLDFTAVAGQVMDAVVHIKSTQTNALAGPGGQPAPGPHRELPDPFRDFFGDFFGPRFYYEAPHPGVPQPSVGSGSGVIINSEGYIVTNNHVIAGASDIEVTLHDNRTYKATVIGTDPSTDLALIQIKEKGLPTLPFVNSDDVRVGEWVLAVGNPLNLNSTVTAGIVSAKSRNINILQDQYAIESFIQTDAAINPGNSGGALVNLQGGLIGINTAIASPTGAYAGYGFAVPSNLVSKVVEDLLKYGVVQRGYLGVTIRGVDGSLAREKDLEVNTGVYVDSVMDESAASDAGIKPGDVIQEINGYKVATAPQLLELVGRYSPGDELKLKVNRKGKERELKVELRNRNGEARYVANNKREILNVLGAEFEEISPSLAKKLNIEGGVKISRLYTGKLMKHTELKEGFIITKVDGRPVQSVEQLANYMQNKEGGVLLEGVYEDVPGVHYYAFGM
ncbi:Do family serine endopeptidase [Cesiribacter sp. SM1]|uniref:Do family serine endopeptidase n=1 Tax=Cesiribacter sp. SM1 TaxID=2861196 RepID=UPI001CD58891|nr:Do family serine endopeptidase [Cesiribacter sp. SM1]